MLVTNMLEKSVGMFWSDTRGKRVSCVDMEIWKIRKELVWVSQQQEMQVKEHATPGSKHTGLLSSHGLPC